MNELAASGVSWKRHKALLAIVACLLPACSQTATIGASEAHAVESTSSVSHLLSSDLEMVEAFRIVAGRDFVTFEVGSAELSNRSKFTLERQALWLNDNPAVRAWIIATGDNASTSERARNLAQARAKAVRDYLRLSGVADLQLEIPDSEPNDVTTGHVESRFGIAMTAIAA